MCSSSHSPPPYTYLSPFTNECCAQEQWLSLFSPSSLGKSNSVMRKQGVGHSHFVCVNRCRQGGSRSNPHKCPRRKRLSMGHSKKRRSQERWRGTLEEEQQDCSVEYHCTEQGQYSLSLVLVKFWAFKNWWVELVGSFRGFWRKLVTLNNFFVFQK